MRKRLVTLALLVALGLAGTAVAKADPQAGGNNPAFVCAPGQTPSDPPTCPGK